MSLVLRFATRSVASALAFLALAACNEGTGPEGLGQLRLRPVFAPGEEPGALGVALSEIRIVLRRADGAVVADTSLPYVAGETTSWLLDLTDPPESIGVLANIGQGATTMYTGSGQVSLPTGIGPSSTSHDLPVRYLSGPNATFTIDISPDSAGLRSAGEMQQFTAVARDANGAPLTGFSFTWASSRPDVATVNAAGLVTAITTGRAEITASSGGVIGTAIATVGVPGAGVPVAVVVKPDSGSIGVGDSLRFKAVAVDAFDDSVPGVVFNWTSSLATVASVDSLGLATAVAVGETRIVASLGLLADTSVLRVTGGPGGPAASVTVIPGHATLASLGATQQFTAVGRDAQGNVLTGVAFTWTSSNPSVATVSASGGLATAASQGTVTIAATAGGHTGTASLTVAQLIKSVSVSPPAVSIFAGMSTPFAAVARDANGHIVPGTVFTWSTVDPSIATVSSAGVATAVNSGSTFINASAGGVTGSGLLFVTAIGSIEILGDEERIVKVGDTPQFAARVRDAAGNVLTGVAVIWSVSQPTVASIDPLTGKAIARSAGWTLVQARVGNVVDAVEMEVRPP